MTTTNVYDPALFTADVATCVAGLRVARHIILLLALCLGLALV